MFPDEIAAHELLVLHLASVNVGVPPPVAVQVTMNVVLVVPEVGDTETVTPVTVGAVTVTGTATLLVTEPLTRQPGVYEPAIEYVHDMVLPLPRFCHAAPEEHLPS